MTLNDVTSADARYLCGSCASCCCTAILVINKYFNERKNYVMHGGNGKRHGMNDGGRIVEGENVLQLYHCRSVSVAVLFGGIR